MTKYYRNLKNYIFALMVLFGFIFLFQIPSFAGSGPFVFDTFNGYKVKQRKKNEKINFYIDRWKSFTELSYWKMQKSPTNRISSLVSYLNRDVASLNDRVQQITSVDQWFNNPDNVDYKDDTPGEVGIKIVDRSPVDIWKDVELLLLNGGDCEDYVFGKYSALRHLGYYKELYFLIGYKYIGGKRISHVILVCDLGDDNVFLLDNIERKTRKANVIDKTFLPLVMLRPSSKEFYIFTS